jgi:beta-glucosidase
MFEFPKGFLWGTATAAHQVEGNNISSDWWDWEHRSSHTTEPSMDACNHLYLYEKDIKLMAELGFNTYRFSIEWARIEPEENCYSKVFLNHYKRVIERVIESGLVPCVTLHHFTSPLWASKKGGFVSKEVCERFLKYVDLIGQNYGEILSYVCSINEPNIVAFMGYRMGLFPPGGQSAELRRAATDSFIHCHNKTYEIIKSYNDKALIGLTLSMTDYQPLQGAEDRAKKIATIMEDIYLESIAQNSDFIGVQTYSRDRTPVSGVSVPEAGRAITEMGYEIYPEALLATVKKAASITNLPVIITENGIAPLKDDDAVRIDFIKRALLCLKQLLETVDIRGYIYWSFLDNFEWNLGYRPKFGLVSVDNRDFSRTVKQSGYFLGNIARTNGSEII